jgi:hypothetical protein
VTSRTHRGSHRQAALGVVAAVSLAVSFAAWSSPRASAATRQPPAETLPCKRALAEGSAQLTQHLDPGDEVFFGKVALPTGRALQAGASGESGPNARLFAKAGLLIKPGTEFELVVSRASRDRLTIGWGGVPKTARLRVAACDAPANNPRGTWIVFAGGYFAPDPACVSVSVKSAHRTARAPIGLGKPCPGQTPVPAGVPNVS